MTLPNLVGQILGQYEIFELLGIGGMGAVYRAQQLRLKRPVALKVLSPVLATQTGYIERFIREAETAASLERSPILSQLSLPVYSPIPCSRSLFVIQFPWWCAMKVPAPAEEAYLPDRIALAASIWPELRLRHMYGVMLMPSMATAASVMTGSKSQPLVHLR